MSFRLLALRARALSHEQVPRERDLVVQRRSVGDIGLRVVMSPEALG